MASTRSSKTRFKHLNVTINIDDKDTCKIWEELLKYYALHLDVRHSTGKISPPNVTSIPLHRAQPKFRSSLNGTEQARTFNEIAEKGRRFTDKQLITF
jgi:hypothetical protein